MAKTSKKRYEYKVTLGKDLQGEPIRKSFYSTKSPADAKRKGERYRLDYEMELCVSGNSCIKAVSFAVWAKSCLETYKKAICQRQYVQRYLLGACAAASHPLLRSDEPQ